MAFLDTFRQEVNKAFTPQRATSFATTKDTTPMNIEKAMRSVVPIAYEQGQKSATRDYTATAHNSFSPEEGRTLRPTTLRKMYYYNPIVKIAIDTIINTACSAPYKITMAEKDMKETPELLEKIKEITNFFKSVNTNKESFGTVLEMLLRDLCILDGACHPAGEKVLMGDGSLKNIEDIEIGDTVITHTGNIKKVYKTFSRQHFGTLYDIYTTETNKVRATEEHPFLICKENKENKCTDKDNLIWEEAQNIEKGDYTVFPKIRFEEYATDLNILDYIKDSNLEQDKEYMWINPSSSNKKIKDETKNKLRYKISPPVKLHKKINLLEWSEIFGLYLARGSCGNNSIYFSFHTDEIEYQHNIISFFSNKGFKVKISSSTKNHKDYIVISSKILMLLFSSLFKISAKSKDIPFLFLNSSSMFTISFLNGLFMGDRCCSEKKGILRYNTISETLINKVILLLNKLNIYTKISKSVRKNRQSIYTICIDLNKTKNIFEPFIKSRGLSLKERRNTSSYIEDDSFFYSAIKKIKSSKNCGDLVYNIEVEDDHSYTINGVVVHNCLEKVRENGKLKELWVVDAACYSNDTEVLTKSGWKLFKDTDIETDEFATRNKEGRFEWQKASEFHKHFYTRDMYHFNKQGVDLLVTDNHRMLLMSDRKDNSYEEKFLLARELGEYNTPTHGHYIIPHKSNWVGNDIIGNIKIGEFSVPIEDWMAFLGIYLSEGNCINSFKNLPGLVTITQKKTSKNFNKIKTLLEKLPFVSTNGIGFSYTENTFTISCSALYDAVSPFGNVCEKYISSFIKDLSPRLLNILLDWMMIGDENISLRKRKSGEVRRSYCTSSKRCSDDIQEIIQKVGNHASIEKIEYTETGCHGYIVYEKISDGSTPSHEIVKGYNDYVYCVSVPNQTLYVRRNGYATWCGNSIHPVVDMHRRISGYQQVINQEVVTSYSPNEIIYMMMNPRTESLYGLSNLEALHRSVTAFIYAESYNLKYFENNHIPKGILDLGANIPEDQLDRFKNFWEAETTGKPHRIMVLGGPVASGTDNKGIQWIPMQVNSRDMELLEYLRWLERLILAVFGVTPSEVGFTENISGAPATGQLLQSSAFKNKAIYPMLGRIANYLTQEIIYQEYKAYDLKFEFIEETTLDERMKKAQIHQIEILTGIKTVNEIRREEGLRPIKKDENGNPIETEVDDDTETNEKIDETMNIAKETESITGLAENKEKLLQDSFNNLANTIKLEEIKKDLDKKINSL